MSIIDTFDDWTDAVISPSQVIERIEGFPKAAAVAFKDVVTDVLLERYKPEHIADIHVCVTVPVYKINYEGLDVAVYCSTLGGSAAVSIMEDMIAMGCENFVFFGSCGVLDKELAAKSLIIPTQAYRDEGTSYHYLPPGDYVEIESAAKLEGIFRELHLPYVSGKVWTTDAFYRETRGNMQKRRNEGCIAVDMECASIMAAAKFRGVNACQFFHADDSLDGVVWDRRTLGSVPPTDEGKFLRIALEAAVRL